MIFVGGDQMTTEMNVPLSRGSPVSPGEEVDVVEMVAPTELGRYLGYWRLTGPHGRRKFGQRVWCHVQVVDPAAAPAVLSEADVLVAMAEIEKKKSETDLGTEDKDDLDKDDDLYDNTPTEADPHTTGQAGPSGAAPAPAPAEPTAPLAKDHKDKAMADVSDPVPVSKEASPATSVATSLASDVHLVPATVVVPSPPTDEGDDSDGSFVVTTEADALLDPEAEGWKAAKAAKKALAAEKKKMMINGKAPETRPWPPRRRR